MNRREAFDWLSNADPTSAIDPVEANRQANEEANNAERELAQLFADVLHHSPRGPELMAYLRDCTIELPLMDVGRSIVKGDVALSPADWAYMREGQNSIVRMMEAQVHRALTPEPAAPEPATEGEDNG